MELEDKLIKEARSWIGTKWRHKQNVKGVGVDCVQLLYEVGMACGCTLAPPPKQYAPISKRGEIITYLAQHCEQVESISKGCILLFKIKGYLTHVGMASDNGGIIHASLSDKMVIEHPLNGKLFDKLDSIWKYKKN